MTVFFVAVSLTYFHLSVKFCQHVYLLEIYIIYHVLGKIMILLPYGNR